MVMSWGTVGQSQLRLRWRVGPGSGMSAGVADDDADVQVIDQQQDGVLPLRAPRPMWYSRLCRRHRWGSVGRVFARPADPRLT